jgi:hypothetical protein
LTSIWQGYLKRYRNLNVILSKKKLFPFSKTKKMGLSFTEYPKKRLKHIGLSLSSFPTFRLWTEIT